MNKFIFGLGVLLLLAYLSFPFVPVIQQTVANNLTIPSAPVVMNATQQSVSAPGWIWLILLGGALA